MEGAEATGLVRLARSAAIGW